jgi:L-aminopeptidase/D-esterase-like protein
MRKSGAGRRAALLGLVALVSCVAGRGGAVSANAAAGTHAAGAASAPAANASGAGAKSAAPAKKPRARDLGVPFDGTPGPLDAITDVRGVEVGHRTLVAGEGAAAVRTGVTAVLPRGKDSIDPVFGGWFAMNGNGEMTGTTWLEESGFLEGPVMITNTSSVGVVRDAVIKWGLRRHQGKGDWSLPVVAETWDGRLNDIDGQHVAAEDAFAALDATAAGPVAEGNVGGGTGMVCHGFKGGIGTASRKLTLDAGGYTVGVLVQCNYGLTAQLRIAGVPVGAELDPGGKTASVPSDANAENGSIIIVIATDAPLLPHQLKRIARRAAMGLARNGSIAGNSSGDIFVAFSTANAGASRAKGLASVELVANDQISPLFEATVQATEEAIINALFAAETMTGLGGTRIEALPVPRALEVLRKFNRLRAGR